MSFLQLVLSLDKTIKEIILFWRICQFDRYRNKDVTKRCTPFSNDVKNGCQSVKFSIEIGRCTFCNLPFQNQFYSVSFSRVKLHSFKLLVFIFYFFFFFVLKHIQCKN